MDNREEIEKIFANFEQLPYLFIGAGFSKRYSSSVSWNDLLFEVWAIVNDGGDGATYKKFVRRVAQELNFEYSGKSEEERKFYLNPQIATEIQKSFNTRCLSDNEFLEDLFFDYEIADILNNDYDFFKYYIAKKFKNTDIDSNREESKELGLLVKNQNKVAGIITTNYDLLIESIFKDFGVLIGQQDLLVSNMSNIFEIYKIHGSAINPDSITITQDDYKEFRDKLKYLSSKLLTIFVEHPVIFIGYGIGDLNIRSILKEIAFGLNAKQLTKLKNNLIFISPAEINEEDLIRNKELEFDGKTITMQEIVLKDYAKLYGALSTIKSSLPIGIIRKMQNMVCNFISTTDTNQNILVSNIDDPNLTDDKLGIYIGSKERIADIGFSNYGIDEIDEDILFDNRPYLLDERIFSKTFKLIRSVAPNTYLPIYKYFEKTECKEKIPDDWKVIDDLNKVKLTTNDMQYSKGVPKFDKIQDIIDYFPGHLPKQISNILANREYIDAEDLKEFLISWYEDDSMRTMNKSDFRKLVAVLDYKLYKK